MKDFLDLTKDIWDFLRIRKKYWLAPLIITIVLMGALLFLPHGVRVISTTVYGLRSLLPLVFAHFDVGLFYLDTFLKMVPGQGIPESYVRT